MICLFQNTLCGYFNEGSCNGMGTNCVATFPSRGWNWNQFGNELTTSDLLRAPSGCRFYILFLLGFMSGLAGGRGSRQLQKVCIDIPAFFPIHLNLRDWTKFADLWYINKSHWHIQIWKVFNPTKILVCARFMNARNASSVIAGMTTLLHILDSSPQAIYWSWESQSHQFSWSNFSS